MDSTDQPGAAPPRETADQEQLKLLVIFHYVIGGMIIFFACFFIIHLVIGIVALANPQLFESHSHKGQGFPPFLAYMFVGMGSLALVMGWTLGGLVIWSGRSIQKRRHRFLSLVVAGIMCIWIPFGTALGVFTFVLLMRPSVKALYGE